MVLANAKINFFGFHDSMSGVAEHAKEFCRALSKAGYDVSLKSEFKNPVWGHDDEINALIEKPVHEEADVAVLLDNPSSWYLQLSRNQAKHFVGIIVFEGSQIPYDIAIEAANPRIEQVWTPSEHSASAIRAGFKYFFPDKASELEKKIRIVPHGVDATMFNPNVQKQEFTDNDKFTFLFVGGWSQGFNDRKGLDYAFKAFVEEFKSSENVRFLFKITSIYNHQGYNPITVLNSIPRENQDVACLQSLIQDLGKKSELASVYRCGDVFVFPSKAEGFGMTALEAMACGVPVIANEYGGHLDFVNNDNGWIVPGVDLVDATDMNRVMYDWAKWNKPSVESWRKAMRYCYDHKDEVKVKGEKARLQAERFTWENSARVAGRCLVELD